MGAQEATTHDECHTRPGQWVSGSNTAPFFLRLQGPPHTEGCVWLEDTRPEATKPSWTAPVTVLGPESSLGVPRKGTPLLEGGPGSHLLASEWNRRG